MESHEQDINDSNSTLEQRHQKRLAILDAEKDFIIEFQRRMGKGKKARHDICFYIQSNARNTFLNEEEEYEAIQIYSRCPLGNAELLETANATEQDKEHLRIIATEFGCFDY